MVSKQSPFGKNICLTAPAVQSVIHVTAIPSQVLQSLYRQRHIALRNFHRIKKALLNFRSAFDLDSFYGRLNVLTRKTAICARVTGVEGQ